MAQDLRDFQRLMNRAIRYIPGKTGRIIEVEGLRFIKSNFQKQGWQDGTLKKWKKRKTKDKRGRDITRYRTNRVGTRGTFNRYGTRIAGRAILVGHNTGPNKLRNSFRSRRSARAVRFFTYKKYAQRHNEGLQGMPPRQFMGPSKSLTKNIEKKLTRELDKLFN